MKTIFVSFIILVFGLSQNNGLAFERDWNRVDIPKKLNAWIDGVEKDLEIDGPMISSGREALEWPCYTKNDIELSFVVDPDLGEIMKPFDELDGTMHAKLIAGNGKRILEATTFTKGQAQGPGKITYKFNEANSNEDFIFRGSFVNGCLESRVLGYNHLPLFDENDKPIFSNDTVLTYVAFHVRGQPQGPIWRSGFSQDGLRTGYFYGQSPENFIDVKNPQNLGGSDLVYVYPDFKTALRGSFDENGRIVTAKQVDIIGEKSSYGGIKELKFSPTFGPQFKADISTKKHLSKEPMLRDPYEAKMVKVDASTIAKAGQGVFLLNDVPKNTIVSYFNGIRLTPSDIFSWNPFRKSSVYLIELTDEEGGDLFLDIPQEFSKWTKYQASAGHKVNHGKHPNAAYTECQHPRFGKILCLHTLQDLPKGTELFSKYDITMDKEGMKQAVEIALGVGQWYSGKPKQQFVQEVKPYLEMAAQLADNIDVNRLLGY